MSTIKDIAEKRVEVSGLQSKAVDLLGEIKVSERWQQYQKVLAIAAEGVEELGVLEAAEKALMVVEYGENGTKKFDGGQVKIYKTMDYDAEVALKYAVDERAFGALSLKAAGFKHLVKSKLPDFVTFGEEAKGSLSTDLSEFLVSN